MIELWKLWEKEWKNAYAFFNTKGNLKTKCRLKAKWYKEFKESFLEVERELGKNIEILRNEVERLHNIIEKTHNQSIVQKKE